tara:strand:+ start:702 stop:1004 length:303 start_codon:yes stop_codon:yes gene_type:complete
MKYIRFQDVASSANVAGTFYYIAVDDINYILTAATTVTVLLEQGRSADAQNDSIVITCGSGDSQKIADKLTHIAGSISHGDIMSVDKDFLSGITDISPAG